MGLTLNLLGIIGIWRWKIFFIEQFKIFLLITKSASIRGLRTTSLHTLG